MKFCTITCLCSLKSWQLLQLFQITVVIPKSGPSSTSGFYLTVLDYLVAMHAESSIFETVSVLCLFFLFLFFMLYVNVW